MEQNVDSLKRRNVNARSRLEVARGVVERQGEKLRKGITNQKSQNHGRFFVFGREKNEHLVEGK